MTDQKKATSHNSWFRTRCFCVRAAAQGCSLPAFTASFVQHYFDEGAIGLVLQIGYNQVQENHEVR